MTECEMVGWHHQVNGHEFEQALGVGDGQGGLTCCGPSWLMPSTSSGGASVMLVYTRYYGILSVSSTSRNDISLLTPSEDSEGEGRAIGSKATAYGQARPNGDR